MPDSPGEYLALTKNGTGWWVTLDGSAPRKAFDIPVVIISEQGLLGAAFAPDFAQSRRLFLHYNPSGVTPEVSRIAEWSVPAGGRAVERRVVLEVPQPYQNHNAGQIAFGPDDMLYIGMGDGGLRDDPFEHGQNPSSLLGSILRLDVRDSTDAQPYAIPGDNPFVGQPNVAPETWVLGVRNPWRFSFDPDGRMIVADVGQDKLEEVSIAPAGANLGWNRREGNACFERSSMPCEGPTMVEPVYVYDHSEGVSITGGLVLPSSSLRDLQGKYLFGDFVSGRLWAIDLPESPGEPATGLVALGRWPVLPTSFALDPEGHPLVVDFGGRVLAMRPSSPPAFPE